MRKIIIFLAVFVVLGAGGFAYYMNQNGLDPLDIGDIKNAVMSTKSKLNKISGIIADENFQGEETKVYKHKDAQGNWYYSNEPPEKGTEVEVKTYRSDANVLPPLPEDKKPEDKQPEDKQPEDKKPKK